MSTLICNPKNDTWFICWNNKRSEIQSYSLVSPSTCMETFWSEVDYYSDEASWLAVLLKNGIDPFETPLK